MAKRDFSHLTKLAPEGLVRLMGAGTEITDEMYLKALGEIIPPLLAEPAMAVLTRTIDPKAERRGRPGNDGISKEQLIAHIREVKRPDVPKQFLEALANRLESGARLTDAERSLKSARKFEKVRRDMLIAGLYEEVHQLLEPGCTEVTHPILGKLAVEDLSLGQREQALKIVQDVLKDAVLVDLPSIDRMRNIVTEWNTGKTHKNL